MSLNRLALHTALFQRLHDAVTVSTTTDPVPVYDKVPDGAAYPYITISNYTGRNDGYLGNERMDHVLVYLSVWSTYRGQHEVQEILGRMDELLNEQPMNLDTGRLVSIRVADTRCDRDADEVTFMGRMTLRAYLQ